MTVWTGSGQSWTGSRQSWTGSGQLWPYSDSFWPDSNNLGPYGNCFGTDSNSCELESNSFNPDRESLETASTSFRSEFRTDPDSFLNRIRTILNPTRAPLMIIVIIGSCILGHDLDPHEIFTFFLQNGPRIFFSLQLKTQFSKFILRNTGYPTKPGFSM